MQYLFHLRDKSLNGVTDGKFCRNNQAVLGRELKVSEVIHILVKPQNQQTFLRCRVSIVSDY